MDFYIDRVITLRREGGRGGRGVRFRSVTAYVNVYVLNLHDKTKKKQRKKKHFFPAFT